MHLLRMAATVAIGLALVPSRPSPAAADDPMGLERTGPDHLRGLPRSLTTPEPENRRIHYLRSQVVYRLAKDVPDLAKFEPKLSHLCRLGAFIQRSDGFYWAHTPVRTYGVAFAGGANLVDPQNLRVAGKVYFFGDQDARCAVYSANQSALMASYVGPLPGD